MTYGRALEAIAQDEIDVFFDLIGLKVEDITFYTPIIQMSIYE